MKILGKSINDETRALEQALDQVFKGSTTFENLSEEMQLNKSLILRILDAKIDIIEKLGNDLKKDREIILKSLQKLSSRRDDPVYISQAVAVDPLFFHFAGPTVAKSKQEFFIALIKNYPDITIFANIDTEQSTEYQAGKLKVEAMNSPKISPSLAKWHGSTRLKKKK
jgi:hypothetical protein